VDFAAFAEPTRRELAALREQVIARIAEPYASAYPKAWGSAVTVTLRGGERLTVRRTHAKGDPEAPLTPIELITKARMLMIHGGVSKTDRLIDAILALSDDEVLPELP
jgi:2-methylcitrate dehydratase PrpD